MSGVSVICGDDDFIVSREAERVFATLSEGITDDYAKERIDATAANMDGVRSALDEFKASVRTLSMFGDKKVVWLKQVNFLADSVTGRAEGTKTLVAELLAELETIDPQSVSVLISASPIDRRRKEYKWLQKHTDLTDYKGGADEASLVALVLETCREQGVEMEPGAAVALVSKVSAHTRLLLEETRKLATYVGNSGDCITEAHVLELVPNFGESDFFEPAEAFFSGDIQWTLDALRRYFFTNKESRPLLASLQNRGRLVLQVRALLDAGLIKTGNRGLPKGELERAKAQFSEAFEGCEDKNAYNIFTQNSWYIGNKIAPAAQTFSLKALVGFQLAFSEAFEGIIERPNQQADVMRDLVIRCLA